MENGYIKDDGTQVACFPNEIEKLVKFYIRDEYGQKYAYTRSLNLYKWSERLGKYIIARSTEECKRLAGSHLGLGKYSLYADDKISNALNDLKFVAQNLLK